MGGKPRNSSSPDHGIVRASTPAEWRAWLDAHHREGGTAWLAFYRAHTGRQSLSYAEAVEEALCYGWIDSVKRRIDDDSYCFKFTPRRPGSLWSKTNKERIARLISTGRMKAAGASMVHRARADGSWERIPAAERSYETPAEILSALARDARAEKTWTELAPSHRRQYVTWVASAKRPETRLRRATRALEMLRDGTSVRTL